MARLNHIRNVQSKTVPLHFSRLMGMMSNTTNLQLSTSKSGSSHVLTLSACGSCFFLYQDINSLSLPLDSATATVWLKILYILQFRHQSSQMNWPVEVGGVFTNCGCMYLYPPLHCHHHAVQLQQYEWYLHPVVYAKTHGPFSVSHSNCTGIRGDLKELEAIHQTPFSILDNSLGELV